MSEANQRARIAYLQSLVEARDDEIKMLCKAKQDAFDLGFKAAGGSIEPLMLRAICRQADNTPPGELVGWQPDIDVVTGRRNISYKCDTCGEPLCRSCSRCQRGWES